MIQPTRDLSLAALLTTVLLWASAFVGIRAIGDTFSPASLTLGRLVIGVLVLTAIARPDKHRFPTGRPLLLVVIYGVVWFGLYNIFLNAGERYLDAGTSALIINIAPAIVALLAGVLLKEGCPRLLVIGMAVAFAGVALIALSSNDSNAVETASGKGVVLCLLAAVVSAPSASSRRSSPSRTSPRSCRSGSAASSAS